MFQSLPGASFVVNGARPDADSALVSAGAEMKWLNGFSMAGIFEGEFSGNVTELCRQGRRQIQLVRFDEPAGASICCPATVRTRRARP